MAELLDEVRERDAVLEEQRHARRERVHHPGERRPFLRHRDEQLAGRSVLEKTDGDVSLVAFDRELVRERRARVREPPALGPRDVHDPFDDALDRRLGRLRVDVLVGRRERLCLLRPVAIDRDRLEPVLPGLDVGVHDVVNRRGLRQIDGLGDRAREERLDRTHHLDVSHVLDRPRAVGRLERAIEDRKVLIAKPRSTLDRAPLLDVGGDRACLGLRVPESSQRGRNGPVDELQHPAAHELLVLHERDVRLDTGGVAVEHEADRPGGGEQAHLGVAVSVIGAKRQGVVPRLARGGEQARRDELVADPVGELAMHVDDAVVRILVPRVRVVRTQGRRDPR